ncbi:ABC transporter permease [Gryllotalpicola koreensis]|uniref:ABC transmembrane type-1 domain-containing protein n=1 Tax=Gryllotalpicola koreensis TaxID=993086 RepID=A0ABP8A0Y8_9MICO
MRLTRTRRVVVLIVASLASLAAWELAARLGLSQLGVLAPPSAVVVELAQNAGLYANNFAATAWVAARGWFWGDLAAIVLAVLFVQFRVLELLLQRLALVLYCLPLVAVMPLLQLTFDPDTARVVLAGLSVFFTTLVGTMLGLRSADGGQLTVVRAWGGGGLAALRFVRTPTGIPAILTGLQIGAAAATLGAVFGEFIGADRGLGVLLINGLQQLHLAQVFAVAVLATLMAAVPYGLLGIARRILVPWSTGLSTAAAEAPGRGSALRRIGNAIGWAVASVAVIIGAWWLYLIAFGVTPFVGKSPAVVWTYLTSLPGAAQNRADLVEALGVTLVHAGAGYAAGLLIGILVATVFVLVPPLELAFTPLTVALRSVPIVALIPVLIVLFGRGLPGVVAITTIVTFFPTLANVQQAMSRVPSDALVLMRSYDASVAQTLWRLRLPTALPAIFASARIAAPAAILGATLAEWLATGDGLGHMIVSARAFHNYTQLWAAAVLLAAVSVVFYSLVSAAERAVLSRFTVAR